MTKENTQNIVKYTDIITLENLEKGLARTKSGAAPGLDGELKAEFTQEKLSKLHSELQKQKYKPKPASKHTIAKPNGGFRTLGISSQKDKVVQAAILNLLEPMAEPRFSDASFGFRPGRNCHDALWTIKYKWQNVAWIINIDIKKCFDTINHKILLEELQTYCDQATVELIGKMLKVGYVDILDPSRTEESSKIGTPQGSLISPILCNIYLNKLDKMISEVLMAKFNRGDERKWIAGYQDRKRLSSEEREAIKTATKLFPELALEGQAEKVKHNRWVIDGKPARDPNDDAFRRLYYVRYADDFLLGFVGPKAEAIEIQSEIVKFLKEKLEFEVNEEKSSIAHAGDKGLLFLGCYVRYIQNNKIVKRDDAPESEVQKLKGIAINRATLKAPIERLLKRAVDRGYAVERPNGSIRATSYRKLCSFENHKIVERFSSIIRGILQYYSCVNQRSDLWPVVSLYRKSCALTLADKLKLRTAAQAFKRFGPSLTIKNELGKEVTSIFYPETLKTKVDFKKGKPSVNELALLENDKIKGSYKDNSGGRAERCQYPECDATEGLELHHINPQKNIKSKSAFEKSLIAKKRATITLCKKHHDKIHHE